MSGARFDEVLATKLTVDSRRPMTAMDQADRDWLLPELAFNSSWLEMLIVQALTKTSPSQSVV